MEKLLRGSFDVVLYTKSNTSVSHWKWNKVVTAMSTVIWARPLAKATRYNQAERWKTEIDHSWMIHVYKKERRKSTNFIKIWCVAWQIYAARNGDAILP